MQMLVTQERVNRGGSKSRPLCVSFFLQILSLSDDSRIEAQTRIVQEYFSIYIPHVDVGHFARQEGVDGGWKINRNSQILGKMIEGAGWKNAKDSGTVQDDRGNAIDGPVPANGDNDGGLVAEGALRKFWNLMSVLRHEDCGIRPLRSEEFSYTALHRAGSVRSGRAIHDTSDHPRHGGSTGRALDPCVRWRATGVRFGNLGRHRAVRFKARQA